MPETLESVKDRISERYLGKSGIHAVGVRRKQNAITVYVQSSGTDAQEGLLRELRDEAAPYDVLVRDSPSATLL